MNTKPNVGQDLLKLAGDPIYRTEPAVYQLPIKEETNDTESMTRICEMKTPEKFGWGYIKRKASEVSAKILPEMMHRALGRILILNMW